MEKKIINHSSFVKNGKPISIKIMGRFYSIADDIEKFYSELKKNYDRIKQEKIKENFNFIEMIDSSRRFAPSLKLI
jgi:hypothetical protein